MQPPDEYSMDELHAYAKANNYPDEARKLQHYLTLRRRSEAGLAGRRDNGRRLEKLRRLIR